jgi:hypothetical protein
VTPADIAMVTRVMGPIVREFTAKTVAAELAPVLARNAALEQRILELETAPTPVPVIGPAGPVGAKGDTGAGITSLVVTAEGRLIAVLTDGRSVDAGPVPKGLDGIKGETGERGPQGEKGLDGAPGRDGIDGKDGASGINGKDGRDGVDGKDGAPGVHGKDGADGLNGADGRDGIDGKDGAPGVNGKDGVDGLNGKDGAPGLNGKDGSPGAPGERGAMGEKGLDGLAGRDGRDGAQGLPGTPGDKGLDGRDGVNGINGKDGLDGLGFDDFDLDLDETRGWLLRLGQGDRVKEWELGIPFDAKVWTAGTVYPKGAGVTWDGGYWLAQAPTSDAPGEGHPAWRLCVRRGKTGREGKQGKDGAPGRDLTQMDPATGRKW